MKNPFCVEHGADNYEEWFDLSKVTHLLCRYKYNKELQHYNSYEKLKELHGVRADFIYHLHIYFTNGLSLETVLSVDQWEDLNNAVEDCFIKRDIKFRLLEEKDTRRTNAKR